MKISKYEEYRMFLVWLSSCDGLPSFSTMNIKLVEGNLTARLLTTENEVIDLIPMYEDYREMVSMLDADL